MSSSYDGSSAEMLPFLELTTNSATRCWTISEGWNATTASGVVPAAMKSIISSYDLVTLIILCPYLGCRVSPQLFKHTAKRDRQWVPRSGLPEHSASVATRALTGIRLKQPTHLPTHRRIFGA